MLFPEAPAFSDKKFLKKFLLHCFSICMGLKSVCQIFKILFQTRNIKILFQTRNINVF